MVARRGLGTESKRFNRIPSSPANADGTDAPDAVHVAQKTIQEFHNEKEPDRQTNPDEAVASGAAVQAATSTSQDLAKKKKTLCQTRDDDGQARGGEQPTTASSVSMMMSSLVELLPCRR